MGPERETSTPPTPTAPRLLPWLSQDGNPCYLTSDTEDSYLMRLADDMEAEQLATSADVLIEAGKVLDDLMAPYTEVRYIAVRLTECLTDVLRVAESRGMRLLEPGPQGASAGEPKKVGPKKASAKGTVRRRPACKPTDPGNSG